MANKAATFAPLAPYASEEERQAIIPFEPAKHTGVARVLIRLRESRCRYEAPPAPVPVLAYHNLATGQPWRPVAARGVADILDELRPRRPFTEHDRAGHPPLRMIERLLSVLQDHCGRSILREDATVRIKPCHLLFEYIRPPLIVQFVVPEQGPHFIAGKFGGVEITHDMTVAGAPARIRRVISAASAGSRRSRSSTKTTKRPFQIAPSRRAAALMPQ